MKNCLSCVYFKPHLFYLGECGIINMIIKIPKDNCKKRIGISDYQTRIRQFKKMLDNNENRWRLLKLEIMDNNIFELEENVN